MHRPTVIFIPADVEDTHAYADEQLCEYEWLLDETRLERSFTDEEIKAFIAEHSADNPECGDYTAEYLAEGNIAAALAYHYGTDPHEDPDTTDTVYYDEDCGKWFVETYRNDSGKFETYHYGGRFAERIPGMNTEARLGDLNIDHLRTCAPEDTLPQSYIDFDGNWHDTGVNWPFYNPPAAPQPEFLDYLEELQQRQPDTRLLMADLYC